MSTIEITNSKVAHWQVFSNCLEDQTITGIKFHGLDEPELKIIIPALEKMPKLLASLTKIEISECRFGKSTNERFFKLIKPSVKYIIFLRSKFVDDGAVVCSKLLKLSSIEISFIGVDMRQAHKSLFKLISKGQATINLALSHGHSNEEYCRGIFETMKNCSTLKSIELFNLQYAVDNMVPALVENTSLTRLLLRSDEIGYKLKDLEKANPKTNLLELILMDFVWQDVLTCNYMQTIGDYYNLTKLDIGSIFFRTDAADQLAGSINKLTNLRSLDISEVLLFTQKLVDAVALSTSITDLSCTYGTFSEIVKKCQSVNYKSLSLKEQVNQDYSVPPLDFTPLWQMTALTKIRVTEMRQLSFNMADLVAGLNSVNCIVTNLEIIDSLTEEKDSVELLKGLKKNSTLKQLSLKNNKLSGPSLQFMCDLIRVNRSIRNLTITDQRKLISRHSFKDIVDALKANRTLLYLDIAIVDRDFAVDFVARELTLANTVLQRFSPVSSDYRVDMWLQRNRQQRGAVEIVLQNIVRAGSVLPTEIWLKIFDYV